METKYLDSQIQHLKWLKHDGTLSDEGAETLAEYEEIKRQLSRLKLVSCGMIEHNADVIMNDKCSKCNLYNTI